MVSRVIFIGETRRGEQEINILRLQALFSPVLKELGVPFSAYITAANSLNLASEWLDGWTQSLADDSGSALDIEEFRDAAVIGFEAKEKDLALLSRHGVPWMNIAIHPLRFLDDLYFHITTSFEFDFSRYAASRGLIDLCVQSLRARYGLVRDQNGPTALAVFGQTPFDRSVYFDGRFRSLGDYLDALDKLAAGYERVLYKPHPHLTMPDVDALIVSRYDAQPCTYTDIYEFFVRENIGMACAISSSVLAEAPYFDIQAEFLEPRAKRFGPPIAYRPLLDDLSLWDALLERTPSVGTALNISRVVPPDYLRQFYSSWGFVTDDALQERKLQEISVRLDETQGALQALNETLSTDDTKQQIKHISENLNKLNGSLNQLDASIQQQLDASLQQQLNASAQHMSQSARLEDLEDLARQVQQLTGRCDQREESLRSLSDVYHQTEESLRSLSDVYHHTNAQLQAVYASTSWRITAPMRYFGQQLQQVKEQGLVARCKALVRKILRYIANVLETRPQWRHRVVWTAHRLGVYDKLKALYHKLQTRSDGPAQHVELESLSGAAACYSNEEQAILAHLSPRAHGIYQKLKSSLKSVGKAE